MYFQNIFTQVVSFILISQTPIHALPAETTSLEIRASVPCDDISKYIVEVSRGSTCKRPPAATCLFYTKGLSQAAKQFSKARGDDMTTIWELWPTAFYNNKAGDTSNALRCIIQDQTKRMTYFRNMSQAMATMCDIFATVMTRDVSDVPLTGIWGQVEFPTLQRSDNDGTVHQIEACSSDGQTIKPYWTRGSTRKIKRQDHAASSVACGTDDDTAASFDDGGDLDVDW